MTLALALSLLAAAIASSMQLAVASFSLSSGAFHRGATIPHEYSFNGFGCTGRNLSPDLAWTPGPANTKSYAITVFDPDARTGVGWWHWIAFDIPKDVTKLATGAGTGTGTGLPQGAVQGRNDFQTVGYGGPCPPVGAPPHHYIFSVYALDVDHIYGVSNLTSGPTLLNAMKGHVLAKASYIGRFGR